MRSHSFSSCAGSGLSHLAPPEENTENTLVALEDDCEVRGGSFIQRVLRPTGRIIKLAVLLGPLLLTWPLRWFRVTSDLWWTYCVFAAEASGALVIKLAQWASSRPDLFGEAACDRFKFLQDRTRPHTWAATERALDASLGSAWHNYLVLEEVPAGSGCIAQVYRGSLREGDTWRPVAVKVLHPGVRASVQGDIELLRGLGRILHVLPQMKWLNPQGMLEEFGRMLAMQLDLREEAQNLITFRRNFAAESTWNVVFPEPLLHYSSSDLLVETFVDGVPFLVMTRR